MTRKQIYQKSIKNATVVDFSGNDGRITDVNKKIKGEE